MGEARHAMDFGAVRQFAAACREGRVLLEDVIGAIRGRVASSERPEVWLHRVPAGALAARARELEALRTRAPELPLFGVPFAVKDNIDVAGLPTTAGCPAFAYVPERSAPVVERLLRAGAILVGKTHLDQFATGLVGTRSPAGPCRNAYDQTVISGGSSSGSAVAVALGLVGFALGTDTAGSGRVPAALNGIVGFKPTLTRIPTAGVVPACQSFDCVSVFGRDVDATREVFEVAAGSASVGSQEAPAPFTFGVPAAPFLGEMDRECEAAFESAVRALETLGGRARSFDADFLAVAASLLYDGPFVAERHRAVGEFVASHPGCIDPTVAHIIRAASQIEASALEAGHRDLEHRRIDARRRLAEFDVVVLPTIPRRFDIAEVQSDPLRTNAELGRFTNFMNLLDLCGCAVPVAPESGEWPSGVPTGVTLVAVGSRDARLLTLAEQLEAALPAVRPPRASAMQTLIPLCVVGAHLRGMPLNPQLHECHGEFVGSVRTSPDYRLWHLAGTQPPKPGLERVASGGRAIEAEIWALPPEGFGRFVAAVPRPLAIGHVTLADGSNAAGFVCEPEGLVGGREVSSFGGWRAYIASRA